MLGLDTMLATYFNIIWTVYVKMNIYSNLLNVCLKLSVSIISKKLFYLKVFLLASTNQQD